MHIADRGRAARPEHLQNFELRCGGFLRRQLHGSDCTTKVFVVSTKTFVAIPRAAHGSSTARRLALLIISIKTFRSHSSLPPILNAQGISKAFGATTLFQNVSFTISEGDRIGVIGPNGSGKSTLLRIMAGPGAPHRGKHTEH